MAKPNQTWKDASYWDRCRETLCGKNKIIVFDLETTGLSPINDRIIEIAAVKYSFDFNTFKIQEEDTLHYFINPERPLPEIITSITGLTDADLMCQKTEVQRFDEIKAFFTPDAVIAGYNSDRFDCKFMESYFARMGEIFQCAGTVDAMKLAQARLKKGEDVTGYKLIEVGGYFGIDFSAHSAIEDARCTAKVMEILLLDGLNDYIKKQKAPEKSDILLRPKVLRVRFWEGYRGFSRIYVETAAGSVFYDIRNRNWGGKDVDISLLDMDYIQSEAWKLAGASDEESFRKFKGA